MIGLRRHTVRVVDHRPEWVTLAAAEVARLRDVLGELALDVQHVGSTAVPGLPAKPILDLAVAVRTPDDIPAVVARLVTAGYLDRGDQGREGGHLCVREAVPDLRTVHLHIVEQTDSQWRAYLAFRDRLRTDAGLRQQYATLKADLAARYPGDRAAYTAGKHDFIRRVLAARSTP
jgi:GrpB-like predicted nucleotidyltransferase (UPF0157 family)